MGLVRIALAGEGGQGVQSIAEIMAEAAYENNQQALYIPNFGLEQRGGVSIAFIQFSDRRIGAPKFQKADIVVALSERAVARTKGYSGPETLFVYDSSFDIAPEDYPRVVKKMIAIPAIETSNEVLHPRVFNIIIMGAVIEMSQVVGFEDVRKALEHKLGYKFEQDPKLRELNFRALEMGREMAQKALQEGVARSV